MKEKAHGGSPRPRRATPAPVIAHQAAWQPGAASALPRANMATIDGRTVHVATHSCEDTYETAVNDGDRISKIRARHATRNRNRKTMVSMPTCGAEVAL